MPQAATDDTSPADVKLRRASQELRITWRDGHETVFPLAFLRRHCPCASCRDEREKGNRNPLAVLSINPAQNIKVVDAQLAGDYAIQLVWSDGHDTGIFDYRYLRGLEEQLPGAAAGQ